MPPTPTPEADEISAVRIITGETDYALIEGLVNTRSNAEWADALELITEYDKVKNKRHISLDSKVKMSFAEKARDIRRDMRIILGLPALSDSERVSLPGSVVVSTSVGW